MITLIDIENTFEKTEHSFMIKKKLSTIGIEGNFHT